MDTIITIWILLQVWTISGGAEITITATLGITSTPPGTIRVSRTDTGTITGMTHRGIVTQAPEISITAAGRV